jgi:O-antigen/teichoic acid export membrane protein
MSNENLEDTGELPEYVGWPGLNMLDSLAQPAEVRTALWRHWRAMSSSDFVGKVAGTYFTRILLMGVSLVTSIAVARILGPAGRGFYAVAVATGALGAQFGTLGLHTSNAYFVARDPEKLPSLTGNTLAVAFGFGGLIVAVLGLILTIWRGLLSIEGALLVLALLSIPFCLAYNLLQNLMVGVQDVRGYNVVEVANKSLPLLLIAMLLLAHAVTVASVFSATVVALVISCLWTLRRLRTRFAGRPQLSPAIFVQSIHYAVKAYLAATFCFLVLRADLFMVQHLLGPEQAGYYSIASTMADYVATLATVIGLILFPKLSALADNRRKLAMTQKASLGTALILLPLVALASLVAKPVVSVLFGAAFAPASFAFVLLMPGMLFLGVHSVAVQFLNSIGYPVSVVIIWGASSVFNIIVNLWAIPRYGIAGASLVSSVSYFLAFFFVVWVIYRTAQDFPAPEASS